MSELIRLSCKRSRVKRFSRITIGDLKLRLTALKTVKSVVVFLRFENVCALQRQE